MSDVENSAGSFVLLQVGKRRFALRADNVEELAPPVKLHKFPHTAPLVVGVIVRRGRVVPVYDIAPVLFGRSSAAHRFYLVVRREFGKVSEPSAIPVTGECELATAEVHALEEDRSSYVAGAIRVGDEAFEVFDFEKLVTSPTAAATPSPEASEREAQP